MRKASIVSIGNEILNGQTVDTNLAYLSEKLFSLGIAVVSGYSVGDETDSIVRALRLALADAEVVLTTGGLGPTDDDLTRQAVGMVLRSELELQPALVESIRNFFARRNLQMPARNVVQAYIPAGAQAIANSIGTAPGIMARSDDKLLISLPGVPAEMKLMFEESLAGPLKVFAEQSPPKISVRKLRCFGAGESTIAQMLGSAMERGRNPLVNCTVQDGVITLCIIATADDKEQAEHIAEKEERLLRDKLGLFVYGTGEQTLAEVIGTKLAKGKKTLAVAESCTGGALARLITDIPGASEYFTCGWVTYSNKAKTSQLGVDADIIQKHGAVSGQVAEAMARNARSKARTDFAISITGIAGPTGGSEQKPVGLVYVGVDSDNGCDITSFILPGERVSIRLRAALTALNILRLQMQI